MSRCLPFFGIVFLAMTFIGCASRSPDVAHGTLAIGTFNIRYANSADGVNRWESRRSMVMDMLRDGDFWGLQEALPEQVADIGAELPAYAIVVRSREREANKGEACPILYRSERWELDESDHGTFWLSETPEAPGSKSWDSSLPRIATMARFVERSSGRGIYVVNVHLDHRGQQARLEAARLVASRIAERRQPDPVVLLGDFNTGPTSPPIRALLDDARVGLRDAWRIRHANGEEQPTFNGWADACSGDRIDFILTSSTLNVESCEIDDSKPSGRWPSDHAAVRAVIRWGD